MSLVVRVQHIHTQNIHKRDCYVLFGGVCISRLSGLYSFHNIKNMVDPCSICYQELSKVNNCVVHPCQHEFCKECIYKLKASNKFKFKCPLCRANIVSVFNVSMYEAYKLFVFNTEGINATASSKQEKLGYTQWSSHSGCHIVVVTQRSSHSGHNTVVIT